MNADYFGTAELTDDLTTSINIRQKIPEEFELLQNYPNPFNPNTVIKYHLPENSFVSIKIYDVLGKEVAALVNEMKQPGYYEVNFDGRDLSSGVYIYTINTNNLLSNSGHTFMQSKKMLLIK